MKRIMVIGNCGAGKSVFAKQLGTLTGLEIIHLDQYYYKPNWKGLERTKWIKLVKNLSAKQEWIMDGNYSATLDLRIKRSNTIIFLDYTTVKCLWRITKRTLKYWRKVRPDEIKGCKERFDFNFYKYVATYNLKKRDQILTKLKNLNNEKQILIFKNDKESNDYLKKINTEPNNRYDDHTRLEFSFGEFQTR